MENRNLQNTTCLDTDTEYISTQTTHLRNIYGVNEGVRPDHQPDTYFMISWYIMEPVDRFYFSSSDIQLIVGNMLMFMTGPHLLKVIAGMSCKHERRQRRKRSTCPLPPSSTPSPSSFGTTITMRPRPLPISPGLPTQRENPGDAHGHKVVLLESFCLTHIPTK